MRTSRKVILILIFAAVTLCGCAKAPEIAREAFSQDTAEMEDWSEYQWTQDAVVGWDAAVGHDAPGSMRIDAGVENDARAVWEVPVEPDTDYKISCWVRTEDVGTAGAGANLSVLDVACLSEDVCGTADWQPITVYGVTGPGQRTLELTMGVGGYGRLNSGVAWFDDATVEKISEMPPGVTVMALGVEKTAESGAPMPTALGLGLTLAVILFIALTVMLLSRPKTPLAGEANPNRAVFWSLLAAGFILRVVLALSYPGLSCDTGCFQGWTLTAGEDLLHFYQNVSFSDYPPLYIYVLGLVGGLCRLLGINSMTAGFTLMVKLPAIAADLIVAVLLYRYGTRQKDMRTGHILMALYLLNPAIWINSTLWGQVDGVLILWLVLYLTALSRRDLHHAAAWLALAVLTKPQGLLLAPLLLFAWIQEADARTILRSVAWGAATFLLVILPFAVQQKPLWILTLLKGTTAQYAYASFNGYNLFSLIGANLKPDNETLLFLPYRIWGMVGIAASVLFSGYVYLRKKDTPHRVWLAALVLITGVFVLGFRMHERYLYPAVALACFWAAESRDRRAWWYAVTVSITVFSNTFQVLARDAIFDGYMHIPADDLLLRIGSLVNCLLLIYIVYLVFAKEKESAAVELSMDTERKPFFTHAYQREPLRRKDIGIVGLITGIYLIVALLNLGGFDTPRSCWTAEDRGETVDITLSEKTALSAFSWYGRLGEGSFSVWAADDTGTYRQIATFESKAYPDFGKWKHAKLDTPVTTDRVRVVADATGVEIAEMGWFDTAGKAVPVAATSPAGAEGALHPVADEPDRVAYYHSYLTGTYFDEIYHVRTAYEQMIHVPAYEYTHPPLGKIIISIGISLFGMTTFGWRLPGTIFGAAMIPLMYAFGYQMFGKRKWATVTALVMALDFMHFTQTRMATVDTYTVFFAIFMFYFMYRYMRRYEEDRSFGYGLAMLLLCGISFGLGGASKWSALYGATALAFYFFWDLYRQAHAPAPSALGGSFGRQTAVTIMACVGIFILIPAAIYTLSYIPFFQVPGTGHKLKDMIELQKSMYHYHSTLVAEHDFACPWWQWLLDGRPLWLFVGEGFPEGTRSTMVTMGNPLIWWPIVPAMIGTGIVGWRYRDKRALFLLVAVVAQLLPWMLISRISFIYHFFPILPFGMLCIVYVPYMLADRYPWVHRAVWWYLGACALLFVWFYPAISGLPVPEWWINSLHWIPDYWYF